MRLEQNGNHPKTQGCSNRFDAAKTEGGAMSEATVSFKIKAFMRLRRSGMEGHSGDGFGDYHDKEGNEEEEALRVESEKNNL